LTAHVGSDPVHQGRTGPKVRPTKKTHQVWGRVVPQRLWFDGDGQELLVRRRFSGNF
jgi:hypothetical protein